MRVKHQSEGIKKGNGQTHDEGVNNVITFIKEHTDKLWVTWEYLVMFSSSFNRKNNLRSDYEHSYDIYIPDLALFLEVDGEKHSKTNQKINDGLAEKYVLEQLGGKIIRLDKRECLGDKADREIYFARKLGKHIKLK